MKQLLQIHDSAVYYKNLYEIKGMVEK